MKALLLGLAGLLTLTLAACSPLRAKAYGGYMQASLEGTVALAQPGASSTPVGVDVEEVLGAGTEGSPYARVELGAGITNLTVSAFHYSSSGSGTLTGDFGNLTAGMPVESDLDLLNIKSAITFELIDFGFLRIAPGFGVDYLDLDLEVRSTSIAALESLEVQVPAPLGYVQGEIELGPFGVTADFGAMRVNLDEVDGSYIDFEGIIHVNPLPHLELFGGYRWMQFDADGEVDGQKYDADVELKGWFIGGGLTF